MARVSAGELSKLAVLFERHHRALFRYFVSMSRTREMAEQVQLLAMALDQERNVARDEPRGAVADEQTEIVLLDMRDQNGRTRFGEGRRQIDHRIISKLPSARPASTQITGDQGGEQRRSGKEKDCP